MGALRGVSEFFTKNQNLKKMGRGDGLGPGRQDK